MTPTFLVLAAGRGSRFGGPKQLAPVGPSGEILMAFAIYDAFLAGFRHFVVVTAPQFVLELGEALQFILDGTEGQLEFAVQPEPTGTAGAVLAAASLVRDRFTVANADDWYGREAYELLWSALGSDLPPDQHFLVTYTLRRTLTDTSCVSRAPCDVRPDGSLRGIEELLDVAPSEEGLAGTSLDGARRVVSLETPVSTNLWGFQSSILRALDKESAHGGESLLPAVVASLVQTGPIAIQTLPTSGLFFGITRPDDLLRVRARLAGLVASGFYPSDLRICC